jgi:hypothetical protein
MKLSMSDYSDFICAHYSPLEFSDRTFNSTFPWLGTVRPELAIYLADWGIRHNCEDLSEDGRANLAKLSCFSGLAASRSLSTRADPWVVLHRKFKHSKLRVSS